MSGKPSITSADGCALTNSLISHRVRPKVDVREHDLAGIPRPVPASVIISTGPPDSPSE